MSRIADALRRAEQERRSALQKEPVVEGAVATAIAKRPPTSAPAEPSKPSTPKSGRRLEESTTVSESLVPFYQRSALVTEQYRALRTRILSQNPTYEHQVLAITSALPKEGKSVTSLNLGCTLAEIQHLQVVVVDCDFRRGSLARMLNQPERPGLADVLAGKATFEEVRRPTPVPNLTFIPAGSTHGRSAPELLTEPHNQELFRRLRSEFHYTIVDTPPLTTVTDMGIIGPMCSAAIVVVRLHRTVEAGAKRAVRLLQVNNIPVLGCLLIGRDAPSGRYGYGYGYGYNYGYYYYRHYPYGSEKNEE